jgi:hypothetical protein
VRLPDFECEHNEGTFRTIFPAFEKKNGQFPLIHRLLHIRLIRKTIVLVSWLRKVTNPCFVSVSNDPAETIHSIGSFHRAHLYFVSLQLVIAFYSYTLAKFPTTAHTQL